MKLFIQFDITPVSGERFSKEIILNVPDMNNKEMIKRECERIIAEHEEKSSRTLSVIDNVWLVSKKKID